MTNSTITTSETMQDHVFIEDMLNFWFQGNELPHACEKSNKYAFAVYRNIKVKEGWELMLGDEFDWQDYFLCQLQSNAYHPKVALAFLDWLAGGSLRTYIGEHLNVKSAQVRAYRELSKWIPNLCGRNVKYIVGRVAEKAKEFKHDDEYCKIWCNQLKRITTKVADFKGSEIRGPEDALKHLALQLSKRANNIAIMADQMLESVEVLMQMQTRYENVEPELPKELPSAESYKGKLSINLDVENVQKWASALGWLTDREEINRGIYQILLESGELVRDNTPFNEGTPRVVSLQKDGFILGNMDYHLVCKTCEKPGGGNCPDCGPCAGYS